MTDNSKEDKNLYNFTDNPNMTRTKELTMTVDTLRRFRDTLAKNIAAWDSFAFNGIGYFEIQDEGNLKLDWDELLAAIKGSITEMMMMRLHLSQKLELFDSMRNAVSRLKRQSVPI